MENKKKHDKWLLAKANLNNIEVSISKTLIGSCSSNNEFVSVNNMLKKSVDWKEESKKLKFQQLIKVANLFIK